MRQAASERSQSEAADAMLVVILMRCCQRCDDAMEEGPEPARKGQPPTNGGGLAGCLVLIYIYGGIDAATLPVRTF